MADNGRQDDTENQLMQVANATGVPATIKGRALNWLGRFIAGSVLYPAVEQARENMDTVSGRSRVNLMLAEAVGRQAVTDPEIMDRAKARFLGNHFRKQENVEVVAVLALEDLRQTDNGSPPPEDETADDDWLNVFSRYAEDASSERMRQLFAKVLSGEIRKAGSFSLATMRFIAELDRETAGAFKEAASYVTVDFVYKRPEWNDDLGKWLALEDAGLLAGASGMLQKTYRFAGQTELVVAISGNMGLVARAAEGTSLQLPAMVLTRVGKELATLVGEPNGRESLVAIAEHLKVQGCTALILGSVLPTQHDHISIKHTEMLWTAPEPEPAG